MTAPVTCIHQVATLVFKRAGTRLHPRVWMEEVCLDCGEILDTKKVGRGDDGYSNREKK